MTPARIITAAVVGVALVFTAVFSQKILESVDADEYTVIQSPVAGSLAWYTTSGVVWQGFGEVTAYKIRSAYKFTDKGVDLRFNDGGHAKIHGSIQYELPADPVKLTDLHRRYKSDDRVRDELVKTATTAAIYLTGTLMSSKESYAERRNDLIHYVTDQVQNGVYRTRQKSEWVTDPVTNQRKEIVTADILLDRDGKPQRQEDSAIAHFGIRIFQFTIDKMPYDDIVEKQIAQQQSLTMEVQTAIAKKAQAEQQAQTAEAEGKANATKAKWEQETIKIKAVTLAEQEKEVGVTNAKREQEIAETQGRQRLNVAGLDKQAAEQTKAQQILLGEGEAERKRLVLAADGALQLRAETYLKSQELWAAAFKGSAWTPQIMMGGHGDSVGPASGVQALVELFTAKAARDLALDLSVIPPAAGPRAAQR